MTEQPAENRFEREARRVGVAATTIDMTRNELVRWIERLMAERDELQAVVDAARDAGPWPLMVRKSTDWRVCAHCEVLVGAVEVGCAPEHAPDCTGIALRDALAAVGQGVG